MNPSKCILTLYFQCLFLFSFSQIVTLSGVVTIHNSGYNTGNIQYISNAQIIGDFATPTTSDNKGKFNLVFIGVDRGKSIDIKIEKYGLEVVNKRDLQDVVIGRKTPLRVYLAPEGQIDKARAELYRVSLEALTARHDLLIARLREEGDESRTVIVELENKLNRVIDSRFEAEKLLKDQLEATKKRLPEFSKKLASVNLDFVSEMYRKAYEYFKIGQIEKAIETLDEVKLDKSAAEALDNLNQLKTDIINLDSALYGEKQRLNNYIQSVLIEAKGYHHQLQYDSAIAKYEKALFLLRQAKDTNHINLANVYLDLAKIYHHLRTYPKELEYRLKHLNLLEKSTAKASGEMINSYQSISLLYYSTGKLEKSIFYQREAYFKLKESNINGSFRLPDVQKKLVDLLREYGQELQKKRQYTAAVEIYQEVKVLQPYNKTIKRLIKQLQRMQNKSNKTDARRK